MCCHGDPGADTSANFAKPRSARSFPISKRSGETICSSRCSHGLIRDLRRLRIFGQRDKLKADRSKEAALSGEKTLGRAVGGVWGSSDDDQRLEAGAGEACGRCVQANFGSGGIFSRRTHIGPDQPPNSQVGYAVRRTLDK